jgi:ketosteroid isomerase-like protein
MFARRTISMLALAWGLAACAKPATQTAAAPAVDSAAVKPALADLWSRWIVADTTGNVAALVAMVDDSARADVRGMPPMMGKAAWQSFFETMKSTKVNSVSVTPDMTIAVSNDLAYQNGSYAEATTTQGKSATEYGRYAMAIVKNADGQWRFGYIMAFADSTVPVKK